MASIRRKDTRWCMMPYACGDMMHLLRKYDVAPVGRNDAMFAPMCRQAHIIREANIIGEANIICRRQTSFKKRTFVGRQKCVFCCVTTTKYVRTVLCYKNSPDYFVFRYTYPLALTGVDSNRYLPGCQHHACKRSYVF